MVSVYSDGHRLQNRSILLESTQISTWSVPMADGRKLAVQLINSQLYLIMLISNCHAMMIVLKKKDHVYKIVTDVGSQFGPIFTMFFGHTPNVIITDFKVAQDAFRKNDFAGKPSTVLCKL